MTITLNSAQRAQLALDLSTGGPAAMYDRLSQYGDPYGSLALGMTNNSTWDAKLSNAFAAKGDATKAHGSTNWQNLNLDLAERYLELYNDNAGVQPNSTQIQDMHRQAYQFADRAPDDWLPNRILNESDDPDAAWDDLLVNRGGSDLINEIVEMAQQGAGLAFPPNFMLQSLTDPNFIEQIAFARQFYDALFDLTLSDWGDILIESTSASLIALAELFLDLPSILDNALNNLLDNLFNDPNLPDPNDPFPSPPGSLEWLENVLQDIGLWPKSPLVLDVDFSGTIELTTLGNTGTYFDLDANGQAELTAWVEDGDGLLAIDLNENGRIDNGLELFGTAGGAEDGFAALRAYDTNADNRITSADADWGNLLIWVDANMDGYSQEGELHTLDALEITSISLDADLLEDTEISGNQITHSATFTTADEATHEIVDAWFDYSAGITRNAEDYTFDLRAAFLPTLRGFGELKDLHVAASIDNTGAGNLMDMLSDLASSVTPGVFDDWGVYLADVDALLLKWAGVDGVAPASRGDHVDARHLEFYEAFTGTPFLQYNQPDPLIEAGAMIEAMYDYIKTYAAVQIVGQIIGDDLFEGAPTYSLFTGSMVGEMTLSQEGIDAIEAMAISSSDAVGVWTHFAQFIGYTQGFDNLTVSEIAALDIAVDNTGEPSLADWADVQTRMVATLGGIIDDAGDFGSFEVNYDNPVYGTSGADILVGLSNSNDDLKGFGGNDTLTGLGGHDRLDGGSGDDTLDGGAGDDYLIGGSGNDTYIYSGGNDTFLESISGSDEIYVEASTGLTISSISDIFRSGSDLVLQFGTGESITIDGHFSGYRIEEITFLSDNSVQNLLSIPDLKTYGSASNDVISSSSTGSSNIVYAYGGNDRITGNGGVDVLFGGSGVDIMDGLGGSDTLHGGTGDDRIEGGSEDDVLYGDEGNDYLYGENGDDEIYGGDGDDVIRGGLGNNTLDGGEGNDSLFGEDGTIFIASIGNDSVTSLGFGALVMPEGIELSDLTFSRALTAEYDGRDGDLSILNGYLVLTDDILISWGANSINLTDHYSYGTDGGEGFVNTILFSDSSTLDLSTFVVNPIGTSGADYINLSFYPSYEFGDREPSEYLVDLNYEIYAYDGNDLINGGYGNDILYGGGGDDIYYLSFGEDYIFDSSGYDVIKLPEYDIFYDHPQVVDFHNFSAVVQANDDVTIGFVDDASYSITFKEQADVTNSARVEEMQIFWRSYDFTNIGTWIFGAVGNLTLETLSGNIHSGIIDDFIFGYSGDENIYGLSGNDEIYAGSGDDYIEGGDGNDHVEGHVGTDTILGGAGDDILDGQFDNDIIDGGSGHDTIYGADGNDDLSGGDNDDILLGDVGDDTLDGGNGDDELHGGLGADVIDGGIGADTIGYRYYDHGNVYVNLSVGEALDANNDLDIFYSIENVVGSYGDDVIVGDSANNILSGHFGADALDGAGGIDTAFYGFAEVGVVLNLGTGFFDEDGDSVGDDTLTNIENLTGSSYDDTLTGNSGDNILIGSSGNDVLAGGGGVDTASYETAIASVNVNLLTGSATDGDGGTDTLSGIENITGSDYDDTFAGNAENNYFEGRAGVDTVSYSGAAEAVIVNLLTGSVTGDGSDTLVNIENIIGSSYGDTLIGNSENNTLNGAGGINTVSYLYASSGVAANIATGTATGDGTDTLISIQNLVGSAYADTLTGDANANSLSGGSGNDSLSGGDGDDLLIGEAGNDTIAGGSGIDTVSYAGAAAGVTISLHAGSASNDGDGGNDTLSGIENITGSSYADSITGSDGANVILTGDGGDAVQARAGNDSITGGTGNDVLYGGDGEDIIYGGAGGDDLRGENHNDALYGQAGADTLRGGYGDDILDGGADNDTLIGNENDDTFILSDGDDSSDGGSGTDTIDASGWGQGITINLHAGTLDKDGDTLSDDTLLNIDNIIATAYNDVITGGQGVNVVHAGGGNDTIYARAGNDTLYGEAGNDTINGVDGDDTIYGGTGADTLTGSTGADAFVWLLGDNDGSLDSITDFSKAGGDIIDIADVLFGAGYDPLNDLISDFVSFTEGASSTTLYIDTAGSGTFSASNDVVTLSGVTDILAGGSGSVSTVTDLQNLISSGTLAV